MPVSHRHLHLHHRRDILGDIDEIVHGKNPFDDGNNDDDNDEKKGHGDGDENSDSKGICCISLDDKRVICSYVFTC